MVIYDACIKIGHPHFTLCDFKKLLIIQRRIFPYLLKFSLPFLMAVVVQNMTFQGLWIGRKSALWVLSQKHFSPPCRTSSGAQLARQMQARQNIQLFLGFEPADKYASFNNELTCMSCVIVPAKNSYIISLESHFPRLYLASLQDIKKHKIYPRP